MSILPSALGMCPAARCTESLSRKLPSPLYSGERGRGFETDFGSLRRPPHPRGRGRGASGTATAQLPNQSDDRTTKPEGIPHGGWSFCLGGEAPPSLIRSAHHRVSYMIRPCFWDREMRSVAYKPASTNSTHDARTGSLSEALTSNAFSQARGTRFSRSA